MISNRGVPVARLIPFPQARKGPRPLGMDKGRVQIGDHFDEPLPPTILAGFTGTRTKRKKRK